MISRKHRSALVHVVVPIALAAMASSACLGDRPTELDAGDGGTGGAGATGGASGGSSGKGGAAGSAGSSGGSAGNAGGSSGGSAGSSTGGTAGTSGGSAGGSGGDAANSGMAGDGAGGDVSVGPPTTLRFLSAPTVSYASEPLYPVAVAITDEDGNTVEAASAEIAIDFGDNPSGASLIGYRTAETIGGIAYFGTVGIDRPGDDYTLTATTSDFSAATSDAFDVTPLPFTRVTTGLHGGIVQSVAVADENTVYAASPVGVWKSTNRGSTWTAANFGNPGQAGLVLVDPENPLNVYITPSNGSGSFGGDSFFFGGKSDNGAEAWRSMGDGVGSGQIGAFAIDPQNPAILYAAGPFGVFRSTDAGENWSQTPFEYACYSLAMDPIVPTTLYAYGYDQDALEPAGIFKSVDSGNEWTLISNDVLPATTSIGGIFALPTGVFVSAGTGGLVRSTNGGAEWEVTTTPGYEVTYAPSDVQRVYVGRGSTVAVSDDGGNTFGDPVTVGDLINGLAVDLADADRVYAATEGGVYTSTNGGQSWSFTSIGISALSVGAVAMHPTLPETVLAGGPDGIYRTANGGVTWAQTVVSGPITAISYEPSDPSIVYACNLSAYFFKSTDGGQTWDAGVDSGGGPYCYDVVVRGQNIWLPTVGGLRKSTNGGTSFGATGATAATYGVDVDSSGQIVYAATNAGTFKSVNGGTDFSPMQPTVLGHDIVIDPSDETRIFVGMECGAAGDVIGNGGISVSSDSGATFGEPAGGQCVGKMVGLPSGALLVTGRSSPPFLLSTDHGVTFTHGGYGIVGEGVGLTASADGQTIFLSTTLGLYKSETGGL